MSSLTRSLSGALILTLSLEHPITNMVAVPAVRERNEVAHHLCQKSSRGRSASVSDSPSIVQFFGMSQDLKRLRAPRVSDSDGKNSGDCNVDAKMATVTLWLANTTLVYAFC